MAMVILYQFFFVSKYKFQMNWIFFVLTGYKENTLVTVYFSHFPGILRKRNRYKKKYEKEI